MGYFKKLVFLLVGCSLLLVGCNNSGSTNSTNNDLVTSQSPRDTTKQVGKIDMVISNIPFPTEILDTLNSIHAIYSDALSNPVDNVSLYSQSNSQAINIGVYGADLCYVISFEQFQKVGMY